MSLSHELRVAEESAFGDPHHPEFTLLDDAPAVRVVDELLDRAIASRASDVHLEPREAGGCVRQRVDGMLRETQTLGQALYGRVLSRIKLLAGMDITDRRTPQDGAHALARAGRAIDIRVASLPTVRGEKLVLRLLDRNERVAGLTALGMPEALRERYRSLIVAPSGFVLICGPTGSGKTTTAYASLLERDGRRDHLCSVEDPVEMRLPDVVQIQVNARTGLTFPCALRGLLRGDPNAILVGEMRDAETARTAVSAALCGQFVVTTLHAESAGESFERLGELGVNPRALASALTGVLAQRLVRRLCGACARPDVGGGYCAAGCAACDGTGFRGRVGIFELLPVTLALRDAIARGAGPVEIQALADDDHDYQQLRTVAQELVRAGTTSAREVVRVLGAACP